MKINAHVIYFDNRDEMLSAMDSAGFEKAVLAGSPPRAVMDSKTLTEDSNAGVLKAIQQNPDRFIGCSYVNPLTDGALDQIAYWADQGFRAVKLFPADGYYPDDRELYPFYQELEKNRMVVYFHMGLADYTFADAVTARHAPNSAYAYPMKIDPICRLFPKINFVILNMGYPLIMEAWSVHHNSTNIYLHLGGKGVFFNAPSTAYCAMGGGGFIPLDFSRVVFGSGVSGDMAGALILCEDAWRRMGCPEGEIQNAVTGNVETLFTSKEKNR